ncbi:MAG: tetratricopeptide repeat protein [Planctomycetes bacterium]|nr:tetratricopeptide repeat protein [Planctomycetota bacterium]
MANTAVTLLRLEDWTNAEHTLRECLAICESLDPDSWRTHNARCLLGESLLGQGKYADAEPLLRGREGLERRAAQIPPQMQRRLTETAGNLARVYELLGKPDDACDAAGLGAGG